MKLKSLNKFKERTELCDMAKYCGTDKEKHGYTKVYYDLMSPFKDKNINFLEIGIYMGKSLNLWDKYFENGNIFAIDNGGVNHPGYDSNKYESTNNSFSSYENSKVKCFNADQKDEYELNKAMDYFQCVDFDFILDDGSHFQECQQKSISILFKNVKSGGYYIIEDVIDYLDLLNGSWWNQQKEDCTDSTDYVFTQFIKTGNIDTEYISEESKKYIIDNIDDIFIYDQLNRNNSPISGTSKLIVIKKK